VMSGAIYAHFAESAIAGKRVSRMEDSDMRGQHEAM